MRICYVDEAGCTGMLPVASSPIQPIFIIVGLVVEQKNLQHLTTDFLNLKRRFFPNLLPSTTRNLDWVLKEIKGSELRKHVRGNSRRKRRQSLGFIDKLVDLLEAHGVQIFGRLWVKGIGDPFDGTPIYTSSMQSICETFQCLLASSNHNGFVIADSRNKPMNTNVSHSIFTKKFRAVGDEYPNILEMVTFGHSENHVGIQLCDLVCSSLLFPMATYSYCLGHVSNIHVDQAYAILKARYGSKIKALQYRYQDPSGRWRGGITVSDAISQRSGGHLF